jgi:hypothetical protein
MTTITPSPALSAPAPVAAGRTARLRGTTYRLQGPSIRDPRLHNSLALLVVHVCGQLQFGWELSISQILICYVTCAVIEVLVVARRSQVIAWPAGALLTGNGIALLLRANGTVHGDWWSFNGWYYFFGVAVFAMATKSFITLGKKHIFNPSNIALVAAFLVLGTTRINPQDFWFGPLSPGLVVTYIALLGAGSVITRRLGLLRLALSFIAVFTVSLGILTLSGHAMAARWSFGPAEGMIFWRTIVTSPEVFIFAYFMITDPKTAPQGKVQRTLFGCAIGLTSALLMAPQDTEFAAKVGFLAGLTLMTAVWPLIGHRLPAVGTLEDDPVAWIRRLVSKARPQGLMPSPIRIGGAFAILFALAAGIVLAGLPARPSYAEPEVLAARPDVSIPAGDLPDLTVSKDFKTVIGTVSDERADAILSEALASLEIERMAAAKGDADMAAAAATGSRLKALKAQIRGGGPDVTVGDGDLSGASLEIVRANPKAIPQIGVDLEGTDADGKPFTASLTLTQVGQHYLIADVRQ